MTVTFHPRRELAPGDCDWIDRVPRRSYDASRAQELKAQTDCYGSSPRRRGTSRQLIWSTYEHLFEGGRLAPATPMVHSALRRRDGRPPIGSAAASVESVRLDPELRDAFAHAGVPRSRDDLIGHPQGAAQVPRRRLTPRSENVSTTASSKDFLDEILRERSKGNPPSVRGSMRRMSDANDCGLAAHREGLRLCQTEVAARMRTSQSAVARLEQEEDGRAAVAG